MLKIDHQKNKTQKKRLLTATLSLLVALVTFVSFGAITANAIKPAGNQAGVQKVNWNLSGDVMPVPPYGLADIVGSDTASKLIVNRPQGNNQLAITGVMNGLTPNTTYTVYPSNSYQPYEETGWDVTGSYTITLTVGTTPYTEYLDLTQTGSDITGTFLALNPAGTQSRWNIDSGSVTGNTLAFDAHYGSNTAMKATFSADIDSNGSLVNGVWHDVDWNTRSGEWFSTAGNATKSFTGDDYWTGLLSKQSPFTFTTDEYGSGSWHLNIKAADLPVGISEMSIWINGGSGTILISDIFNI